MRSAWPTRAIVPPPRRRDLLVWGVALGVVLAAGNASAADAAHAPGAAAKRSLAALDYLGLGAYFALNLAIGWWCSRRRTGSDDFFRGGSRIGWWAAGISYMATGVSSISFMVLPAAAFTANWVLLNVAIFQSVAVVVAGLCFVGTLRRLNITTVFEYLERRFNRAVRLLGASIMVLSQIGGRLSIVMLLPSMAFSAVTGLNVHVSIALMGSVTLIYCLEGGMKAVVWTDVLQFFLMYGGIAIALMAIAAEVPGGFGGILALAEAEGKFKLAILDWDFTQPSIWVFACLGVSSIFMQLGDQSLMQRAFSTPDAKSARLSVVLGGALILPISAMLFFVGTALFAFYRHQPAALDAALPTDSIFPYFIGNELPVGVVGLIIAAIFAAAMSTVSGTLNAISAVMVQDFFLPSRPQATDETRMRLARGVTVVAGLLTTGIALVMASLKITSLWEVFATLMALIGGGFPAVFALGLLTRRANAAGVSIGLVASVAVTFAVKTYTSLHYFFYVSAAVGTCIVVGYLASLCFRPDPRPLDGLTIYTLDRVRPVVPPRAEKVCSGDELAVPD